MNAIISARPRNGASIRDTVNSSPDAVRTRSPGFTSLAGTVTHVVVMGPSCPIAWPRTVRMDSGGAEQGVWVGE